MTNSRVGGKGTRGRTEQCMRISLAADYAILLMETDAVTGKDAQDMHSEAQAADALRKLKAENRNLAKRKELILKAEAARNQ